MSRPRPRASRVVALATVCAVVAGCGGSGAGRHTDVPAGIPASLLAGLRTVGRGKRFLPPATGPVLGGCRPRLGRRAESHVELFAANHVVLIAAGVGTRAPRHLEDARVVKARCFGLVVTLDPTGIVYVRAGAVATIGELFRSWGEPLSGTRIASFRGRQVTVYVGGRIERIAPAAVPLTPGAEIVLEVGPHVPPHRAFTFPPPPPAAMR